MTNNVVLDNSISNRKYFIESMASFIKCLVIAFIILIAVSAFSYVFADSTSSNLNFVTKGQEIMKIITGPLAKMIAVACLVGAGIAYAFQGEDYKNLTKGLMYLCLVIALALGAVNVVEFLGGTDTIPQVLTITD